MPRLLLCLCASICLILCLYADVFRLPSPRGWLNLLSTLSSGPEYESQQPGPCSQLPQLLPELHGKLWQTLESRLSTPHFANRTAELLGGAVRIPTEVYDVMGTIGEDPRWDVFSELHDYLSEAFPLVHAALSLTKVNTYGLVYAWHGSADTLKPLLLTAHQDVVPVDPNNAVNWMYPPYSGYYDGIRVWGRGAADDKNGLISILTAVELLLEHGFAPRRTVVLAFGFDEEATGLQGAFEIGKYLLKTYGEDGFTMLVDEGDPIEDSYGLPFARPAVAEKGYFDLGIDVSAPGGHSSIPPQHTAIGLLASLLVAYEAAAPPSHLTRSSLAYTYAQCLAAHAPLLPATLRADIRASRTSDAALRRVEAALFAGDAALAARERTTQATDIIWGGVKSNALPEGSGAVVNHRIAVDSSVAALKAHASAVLGPVAASLGMTFSAFADPAGAYTANGSATGHVRLSDAWGTALEPAPVSPTDSEQWRVLAGSIRASWGPAAGHSSLEEPGVVVVPSLLGGNTDTQFYWALTPHIFRYNHYYARKGAADGSIHAVDEACEVQALVEMVRFFVALVLNTDESEEI